MKMKIEGPVCRLGHNAGPHQAIQILLSRTGRHFDAGGRARFDPVGSDSLTGPVSNDAGYCIIVAGHNFGSDFIADDICALKQMGIPCVIAASFARHFFREAVNSGMPLIESRETYERIGAGEHITIDFEHGQIAGDAGPISFPAYPEVFSRIISAGGLLASTRKAISRLPSG
jgi:3-isopropylmalate/(R)-2-methylmalate dehydratase small subunit